MSTQLMGCCLDTGILWNAFANDTSVREACRQFVREIMRIFEANAAFLAPDNSTFSASASSLLQDGDSFVSILSSIKSDDSELLSDV